LLEAARQFTAHYWSSAHPVMVGWFYRDFLLPVLPLCLVALVPPALGRGRVGSSAGGLRSYEWVACGALAAAPALLLIAALFTTHAFVTRYAIWAVPGCAIALAAGLGRALAHARVPALALLAALLAFFAFQEAYVIRKSPVIRSAVEISRIIGDVPAAPEPIVVTDHHAFLEMQFYEPPAIAHRLVYPLSRRLDLQYYDADTGALLLDALRRRMPLRVRDLEAFLAANPRFFLAAGPADWLPWHLAASGYRVTPLKPAPQPWLFLAEAQR
jgi:hypothetical protein